MEIIPIRHEEEEGGGGSCDSSVVYGRLGGAAGDLQLCMCGCEGIFT